MRGRRAASAERVRTDDRLLRAHLAAGADGGDRDADQALRGGDRGGPGALPGTGGEFYRAGDGFGADFGVRGVFAHRQAGAGGEAPGVGFGAGGGAADGGATERAAATGGDDEAVPVVDGGKWVEAVAQSHRSDVPASWSPVGWLR